MANKTIHRRQYHCHHMSQIQDKRKTINRTYLDSVEPQDSLISFAISHCPSSSTWALSSTTSLSCFARCAFCINFKLRVPLLSCLADMVGVEIIL